MFGRVGRILHASSRALHQVPHRAIASTPLRQGSRASSAVCALSVAGAALGAFAAAAHFTAAAEEDASRGQTAKDGEEAERERIRRVLRANPGSGANAKAPIYRIVLTGGPCAGKSTALSQISDRLKSLGFRVFVVPEAATIVITGGGLWKDAAHMTADQALAFEGNLMKTKMALEDAFYGIAEASGEPSVIICDRGTMDTQAYLPASSFEVLLDEYGWSVPNLRDKRYDAVIHMVTAAIGAEQYYTTENNAARSETPEESRVLDFKILNAWVGHPSIFIIDNSTGLQQKIQRVVRQVCQVVGAPKPVNFKRKFVVKNPNFTLPVKHETFEVEQTYLVDPNKNNKLGRGFTFVRRRTQNGVNHYSYSETRDLVNADVSGDEKPEKTVLERQISGREYIALLKQADPKRMTVKKRVRCFVYQNHYFQLSSFVEPNNSLTVLETECADLNAGVILPSWLPVDLEVTNQKEFTSFKIARKPSTSSPATVAN
eukprot:TRINITY_DN27559_c0_g1_i1.p1 TRINITY_DN27559_c0_g1~~TRINITY_DN27559_c0_g1_i1.p1  ORF type:complete len:545 (-),score=176.15 TRINITY_DN27559_c0_g1_i1:249-1712(-)